MRVGTVEQMFAGVLPATTATLAESRRLRDFKPGEDLLACDEMPACLYHLFDGRAKVWRPSRDGHALVLYFFGPGEVTGVISSIRTRPTPAAITAVTPVRTECWPAALFRQLMRGDPQFAENVLRLVSDRFSILVERLVDLTSGRVDQQLARVLLRLAGEDGAWEDTRSVTVPVTRQDLADMAGTTLHTASRVLSGWGERGLVASTRGHVTVLQPHALATLAQLDG